MQSVNQTHAHHIASEREQYVSIGTGDNVFIFHDKSYHIQVWIPQHADRTQV